MVRKPSMEKEGEEEEEEGEAEVDYRMKSEILRLLKTLILT